MRWLAAFLFLLLCANAEAANRFWVPLTVTGAISGTGGLCRLTVNDTTNLSAGAAVIVAGILGATACDGTTTVTTVVDATHVEVNLAFGLTYTSGGTVAGGKWTSTGTGNWSATSGGAGGQSVPSSSDAVTFDASSGGGTVIPNYDFTVVTITMGAFTGTLSFSVNNNSPTFAGTSPGLSNSGAGVRTLNMGNGTWTVTGTGTVWDFSTVTNLTFNANSSTLVFNGTGTTVRNIILGASKSYNVITMGANANTLTGLTTTNFSSASNTIATFNVTGPNYLRFANGVTTTFTNAMTVTGTSASPVTMASNSIALSATLSSGVANTWTWTAVRDIATAGAGSFTANNSFNLGNTNVTVNGPSSGGACILGGWLLWRDMPEHLNDNFPAWLEKAA